MKLAEALRQILFMVNRLRDAVPVEQLVGLIGELCLLKLFSDQAKGGYSQKLKALGLSPELFKESRFKDLHYEELIIILKKVKESPLLKDVFVSCEVCKDNVLWLERFNSVMEILEEMDFLPILNKDQEEGTYEVGEIFRELIDQLKQIGRQGGIASKSLNTLIASLSNETEAKVIYDPVIGTGSLAVQVALLNQIPTIYGQELSREEVRLCKMLLIAYGMVDSLSHIVAGDTLLDPQHTEGDVLCQFKNIVAVLPFGSSFISKEALEKDRYARYREIGNLRSSEMLFMHHILASLEEGGVASVVTSNGVLFRGGTEAKMRENLLKENCIDCVIQLPNKMLADTAISTTLIIMKKHRTRQDILFMDLTKEVDKISKVTTQLSSRTIEKATKLYKAYKSSEISQVVPIKEVMASQSNLSATRYVTYKEEQPIDLEEVNQSITALEQELRDIQEKIKAKLQ